MFTASTAFAAPRDEPRGEFSDCFDAAALHYGLSVTLLRAVAKVESNYRVDAIHQNADGTHDVGVMQINSSHFGRLKTLGISEEALLSRPCTNISVGASILAGFVRQFGMTWRAVGSYAAGTHSQKEAARMSYALLVQRSFDRIVSGRAATPEATRTVASVSPVAPAAPAAVRAAPTLTPRLMVLE